MAIPQPILVSSRRQKSALHALGDIADAAGSSASFAEAGVIAFTRLIGAELTTLSRCDLQEARRAVVGVPSASVRPSERAAFDRHFFEHPLVRYHAIERGAYTRRITDCMTQSDFRETPVYNDYYRRIGITHVLAVPLRMDGHELASFVLNRRGRDFDDEEVALIDAMRRPLAGFFAHALAAGRTAPDIHPGTALHFGLTRRESEVLGWVAAGKTDRDIAALLGCSARTVHKHLQRVYAKLGVETRTAAVMRCLGATTSAGSSRGPASPAR